MKVKVAHGNFYTETSHFDPALQTEDDKRLENQWKKYLVVKKRQKEQKKQDKLLNTHLEEAARMKHLEPIEALLANLKTQTKRFQEKVDPRPPYDKFEKATTSVRKSKVIFEVAARPTASEAIFQ